MGIQDQMGFKTKYRDVMWRPLRPFPYIYVYGHTDVRMENLPFLQNFVPYRGSKSTWIDKNEFMPYNDG